MDTLSTERRSSNMRQIRSTDTAPELAVRRIVYPLGFRYRLHRNDLPGKPDLAFISRKKVIFVHGCFWHQHSCREGRVPGSRLEYWKPKLTRNKERDAANQALLRAKGWKVLLVWECELNDPRLLAERIGRFLGQ
jgi:DNA mismatch endonuclease (patch repair protein)